MGSLEGGGGGGGFVKAKRSVAKFTSFPILNKQ